MSELVNPTRVWRTRRHSLKRGFELFAQRVHDICHASAVVEGNSISVVGSEARDVVVFLELKFPGCAFHAQVLRECSVLADGNVFDTTFFASVTV